MRSLVRDETAALREGRVAALEVARVWPFAGMRALVRDEVVSM